MNADSENTPLSATPVPENFKMKIASFLSLVTLLFIAGLTASVVGYQVKKAEWDRTAILMSTYESLGGTRAMLTDPRQSLTLTPSAMAAPNSERVAFATAFEVNERVRAYGLYRTLENTPVEHAASLASAMDAVGATEAANLVRQARAALSTTKSPAAGSSGTSNTTADLKPISAEAARLSKRYDRGLARATQLALFRFMHEHLSTNSERAKVAQY